MLKLKDHNLALTSKLEIHIQTNAYNNYHHKMKPVKFRRLNDEVLLVGPFLLKDLLLYNEILLKFSIREKRI